MVHASANFSILLLHHPSVDQRDNACPDSHECRNRSGLFEATALEDRTFGPAACQSAAKFGSDSLLMKFADGVALIWRENQRHASTSAALLTGAQRLRRGDSGP